MAGLSIPNLVSIAVSNDFHETMCVCVYMYVYMSVCMYVYVDIRMIRGFFSREGQGR